MNPVINLVTHPGAALVLTVFLLTPSPVRGADDMTMGRLPCCYEMMNQERTMRDSFKEQDAEINDCIAKLKIATEDKKIGLMSDIIVLMVKQRTAQDERRVEMGKRMMMHAQCHAGTGSEKVMSQCKSRGWIGMHDSPWDNE